MTTSIAAVSARYRDTIYAIFRILVGFLFLSHGLQKLGFLGGDPMTGFMAFIGWAELLGGAGVLLGVLTQLAALGSAIIMIGAYVTVHMDKALLPIQNNGESALLYLAAFLIIIVHGAGKWSIEAKMRSSGGATPPSVDS
jgi:putative oxidoreductase|tara:strand:+ start:378 stop:797 length:420 start_codon:yes stop_codon:yes gene_type:complete